MQVIRESKEISRIIKKASEGEAAFPVYIFHGSRPITTPMCEKLASALSGNIETNVERFSGDTISEGRVIEFLMTLGLFAEGRKVAWIQDPPFLEGAGSVSAKWKRLVTAFEKGNIEKSMRILGALLKEQGIDADTFLAMHPDEIRETIGLTEDENAAVQEILTFTRERRIEFADIVDSCKNAATGKLIEWLQGEHAGRSSVILQSENIDKRCKAVRLLSELGPFMEFDVKGSGKARSASAAAMVKQWFKEDGQAFEPGVAELLVSLAGNDPVFLKAEVGKLISSKAGHRISKRDVKTLISRTREEELYRLTGAIAEHNLPSALESLRLILSQGVSPVAIVSAIGNQIRRLTMLKAAVLAGPGTEKVKRASAREFETAILPALRTYFKENGTIAGHDKKEHSKKKEGKKGALPLSGHPYAIYMATRSLHLFSMERLTELLARMSDFDLAVKGGSSSPEYFLEYMIFEIIMGRNDKEDTICHYFAKRH